MKPLAAALLIGVFARHGAANWLAEGSSLSSAAWFYILGGVWEATLCGLILWAIMGYRWTLWRGLASAGCLIGMMEGSQLAVCRLGITDIKAVPTGVNLCDYWSGFPVGAVAFSLYLLIICWHFGRYVRERAQ